MKRKISYNNLSSHDIKTKEKNTENSYSNIYKNYDYGQFIETDDNLNNNFIESIAMRDLSTIYETSKELLSDSDENLEANCKISDETKNQFSPKKEISEQNFIDNTDSSKTSISRFRKCIETSSER